jgi:phospholipid/cholesterol/gamma-HCH transport system ATP-binding protein
MVIVSHDLESILNISHRIIMLDASIKGILATGTTNELKNYKENKDVYNFFNRML